MYPVHIALLLVAFMLCGSQVAAISHGDLSDFDGQPIRYQQIAKDTFVGVPLDSWDDKVHRRSDIELDVERYMTHDTLSNDDIGIARDLKHESRNLEETCQAVIACTQVAGEAAVTGVINAFMATLKASAKAGESIWKEVGNAKYVANFVSQTGATVFALWIYYTIFPPANAVTDSSSAEDAFASCSTGKTVEDTIESTLNAALSSHPDASSATIDLNTGAGTFTISVATGPEGEDPSKPPSGSC